MNEESNKIKRLIFATGPWQIIIALSAMRQESTSSSLSYEDHLFLYFYRIPDETKQIMLQIANLLGDWKSIIQINEAFLDTALIEVNQTSFLQYSNNIKKIINIDKINEIWICLMAGKLEKLLIESYLEADIVIYEDGLCMYAKEIGYNRFLDKNYISMARKLKHESINFIRRKSNNIYIYNNTGLVNKHVDRLTKAYLFLSKMLHYPDYLKKASIKQINNDSIEDSIMTINRNNKFFQALDKNKYSEPMVLVLSQCFSKWHRMSWDEELSIYKQALKTIIQHGLTPLWKEHPRADRPFLKSLLEENLDIQPIELNIHFSWPVELLIHRINILSCVSISSSSLFYIKELFNIPTYTLADELIFSKLSKHDTEIAKLASKEIPPFRTMF
ncbi:MAG: polysialyltransferase family glycosyltransferase [Thermosynechococcaceae cyanobacterium]